MSDTQSAPATGAATNGSVQFRDAPAEGVNARDRNALLKAASDAMRASEAKAAEAAKAAKAPESVKIEPDPAAPASEPESEEPAEASGEGEGESLAEEAASSEPVQAKAADKPDLAANMRRLLKLKEQEQTERERIEADARQLRDQATAEARKIIEDAKSEAQRQVRAVLENMRGRPLDAARELGFDLDTVLAQQADEKDPGVQMRRWLESELGGIKKSLAEQAARNKALEEKNEEWQRLASDTAKTNAQERFLSQAQDDAYEFARELWGPQDLISRAQSVIADVQRESEREGKRYRPTNAEVLAYLNEQAQEHLKAKAPSWAKLLQKVGAVAVAESPKAEEKPSAKAAVSTRPGSNGKAPAGQGHGPRTLTAQAQSERRTPPKGQDKELSEREFRELAVASVGEILRSSK